jgi:hypothetical protein
VKDTIEFEGRELRTLGDIMETVVLIAGSGDKLRAAAFIEAYEKIAAPDVVRKNLGYGAGYYDTETATKIYEVFDVRHPIFGRTFPKPEWAMEMGMRRANGGRPPRKVIE